MVSIFIIKPKIKITKDDIDKVNLKREKIKDFIKINYSNYTEKDINEYIKFCETCNKIGELK